MTTDASGKTHESDAQKNGDRVSGAADLSRDDILKLLENLQVHRVELEMQNEELLRAQVDIEEARDMYRDLFEFSPIGYFTLNAKGIIQEINVTGAAMTGFERRTMKGKPFTDYVHRDDQDIFYLYMRKLAETGERENGEIRLLRSDGAYFNARLDGLGARNDAGEPKRVRLAVTDITGQKLSDRKIRELLDEKDLMVRETHHRVKNNILTILSILSIHRDRLPDGFARETLTETTNRLRSMIVLYDKMSLPGKFASIGAGEYLGPLVEEIGRFTAAEGARVEMVHDIDEVVFPARNALAIGMLVNELITNSMKHGFPEGRRGTVRVSLKRHDRSDLILTVSDDGVGMPNGADAPSSRGLGMGIVLALVKQLKGYLNISREGGSEFRVVFPLE